MNNDHVCKRTTSFRLEHAFQSIDRLMFRSRKAKQTLDTSQYRLVQLFYTMIFYYLDYVSIDNAHATLG
jgi:hypothetical protein